jgi:hypothetical protein
MKKRTISLLVFVTAVLSNAKAQKGEKSIAAGLLLALPENRNIIRYDDRSSNMGVGLEGIGQYNFTQKSAALLQLQLTLFNGYRNDNFQLKVRPLILSLRGGYRYQFTTSGFYANALAGLESYGLGTSATLGVGKRFTVKDRYFLDTGIDYTGGFIRRYNIKAVFSLLRTSKRD